MTNRSVLIPKFLQELHGEKASTYSLLVVYATGIITTSIFIFYLLPLKLPAWKYILSALLILDISSGVVANFSSSTNQFYQKNRKLRITFLLIHFIHPALFYFIFPDMLNLFLFMGLYAVISALIVNFLNDRELQQNMASSLIAVGFIVSFLIKSDILILYSLPLLFMLKLVLGFSVRRPDFEIAE